MIDGTVARKTGTANEFNWIINIYLTFDLQFS